jgi:hypothetical protein
MESNVKFLEQLEKDFQALVEREAMRKPPPRRRSVRWKGWVGAAASLLVLAFVIGTVAQLGGGGTAARKFSTVGSAVNGDGGAAREPAIAPNPGASQAADAGAVTDHEGSLDLGKRASTGEAGVDLSRIIRDGTIAVSVPDGTFATKRDQVVAIANANRGFVLSSQTESGTTGSLTLRIPAARFDAAMTQIGKLGDVESSSVTGKDVTNQYVDYQAHLQNLIGRRTVLRNLLAQTTTIRESLTVENQLQDVQLQIDQIQGQLRYLDNQVAESTLTVDLHEASAPVGESQTDGSIHNPSLSRAWDRAIQGFFGILATIIVGLGYLLPIAVIGAVAYGVVMLVRRRGRAAS